MHWRDAKPLGNPDSHSSETTHTRSGSTLLTGFGDVDVPDGKVGEEAGIKTDNEGHVGVVLNGNATTVLSIALRKFYPSDDTQDILLRQLGRRATVKRIAADARSTTAPPRRTHKTTCSSGSPSPAPPCRCLRKPTSMKRAAIRGATNFVFYRTRPDQRIASMKCRGADA